MGRRLQADHTYDSETAWSDAQVASQTKFPTYSSDPYMWQHSLCSPCVEGEAAVPGSTHDILWLHFSHIKHTDLPVSDSYIDYQAEFYVKPEYTIYQYRLDGGVWVSVHDYDGYNDVKELFDLPEGLHKLEVRTVLRYFPKEAWKLGIDLSGAAFPVEAVKVDGVEYIDISHVPQCMYFRSAQSPPEMDLQFDGHTSNKANARYLRFHAPQTQANATMYYKIVKRGDDPINFRYSPLLEGHPLDGEETPVRYGFQASPYLGTGDTTVFNSHYPYSISSSSHAYIAGYDSDATLSSFWYRLNLRTYFVVPALSDGEFALYVKVVNATGHVKNTYHTEFDVDAAAPETTIHMCPEGMASLAGEHVMQASCDQEPCTYRYRLDTDAKNAWEYTDTGMISVTTSPGTHTLLVQAIDTNANVDPTPAHCTWTDQSAEELKKTFRTLSVSLTKPAEVQAAQVRGLTSA